MKSGFAVCLLFASAAFAQQPQYTVTPAFAYPGDGVVVHLRGPDPGCANLCQVAFGGVVSPAVTQVAGGFDAVAPPHAEGVVPITISLGSQVLARIDSQFAYIVHREQVLVPITADGVSGPYGALWATELWVHNGSDQDVTLQPAVCNVFGRPVACGADPMLVKANSSRLLPSIPFAMPNAIGLFLYPPREQSAQLSFDARLLDRTRLGGGTALPIVRESAMQRPQLTMLNVPGDNARLRKRLRIYYDDNSRFTVRVYDLDSGRQLAERQFSVFVPTDGPGQPLLAYTVNDDVFDGGAARLRVEVERVFPPPGASAWWAFISATDNVTQEVTIIAPQ
jgi:hypothetical protein